MLIGIRLGAMYARMLRIDWSLSIVCSLHTVPMAHIGQSGYTVKTIEQGPFSMVKPTPV